MSVKSVCVLCLYMYVYDVPCVCLYRYVCVQVFVLNSTKFKALFAPRTTQYLRQAAAAAVR